MYKKGKPKNWLLCVNSVNYLYECIVQFQNQQQGSKFSAKNPDACTNLCFVFITLEMYEGKKKWKKIQNKQCFANTYHKEEKNCVFYEKIYY